MLLSGCGAVAHRALLAKYCLTRRCVEYVYNPRKNITEKASVRAVLVQPGRAHAVGVGSFGVLDDPNPG